jgi:hypothetical protein
MSADVGDAVLDFRLGSGLGLSGKREDSCLLPFTKPRQQHDLAIGKLERVMMDVKRAFVDLAKDRNGVAGIGTKHKGGLIRDWLLEREFGTRKYADSYRTILRRGESSRASAEVVCDEFFAHFGWAGSHTVQTVVAHLKELLSPKPPNTAMLPEKTPGRIKWLANQRFAHAMQRLKIELACIAAMLLAPVRAQAHSRCIRVIKFSSYAPR